MRLWMLLLLVIIPFCPKQLIKNATFILKERNTHKWYF